MQWIVDLFWSWMMPFLLALFGLSAGGCVTTLTGEGEWAVGMRNSNELVVRHSVEEGNEAESKAEFELDANMWDLLVPNPTPDPDETPEP